MLRFTFDSAKFGRVYSDLRIGADLSSAQKLLANSRMCWQGVKLVGDGFLVEPSALEAIRVEGAEQVRPFLSNRDLVQSSRGLHVIDFSGLTLDEARQANPAAFQQVADRVKPLRDQNVRASIQSLWWRFAWERPVMRSAVRSLDRFIVTPEVAKYRPFCFVRQLVPDASLYVIASDCAHLLGVLSSCVQEGWARHAGGTLEDRPRYHNSRCFDPFPFPAEDTGLTQELTDRIRTLAEQLDAHRKARQAAHEAVTLTGLYNVLDKLRRSEALTTKDKLLHEQGLVGVLKSLHDDLDAAVLAAYGWSDLGLVPWGNDEAHRTWTEALLTRLVALNQRRAAEEAQGTVRWLRPEFQDPARRQAALPAPTPALEPTPTPTQTLLAVDTPPEAAGTPDEAEGDAPATGPLNPNRQPWPPELPAQMRAVAETLARLPGAVTEAALAEHFAGRGPWKKRLPQILQTLEALGRAQATADGWRAL